VKASNPYDTVTTYFSNHGLVDSTKTVFGGRTYTIRAQYTTAGWLDSVTATGSAGSFMGRRYLYNSGLGTLTDLRLSGQAVTHIGRPHNIGKLAIQPGNDVRRGPRRREQRGPGARLESG